MATGNEWYPHIRGEAICLIRPDHWIVPAKSQIGLPSKTDHMIL